MIEEQTRTRNVRPFDWPIPLSIVNSKQLNFSTNQGFKRFVYLVQNEQGRFNVRIDDMRSTGSLPAHQQFYAFPEMVSGERAQRKYSQLTERF